MVWDARLQFRNGFYYAAGFIVIFFIVGLNWLSADLRTWLLPPFVFTNVLMNTFYFLGGLVLLEKGEGTLEAQVVTPLHTWEYLASKVAALTGLALLENTTMIVLSHGVDFNWLLFLAGAIQASALYALCGFAVVSRYDSINEYLLPSFVYTLLFSPPLFAYFDMLQGSWLYLHPYTGSMILLQAAFTPVPAGELVYALIYPMAWIVAFFFWSRSAFHRFVIAKEGTR